MDEYAYDEPAPRSDDSLMDGERPERDWGPATDSWPPQGDDQVHESLRWGRITRGDSHWNYVNCRTGGLRSSAGGCDRFYPELWPEAISTRGNYWTVDREGYPINRTFWTLARDPDTNRPLLGPGRDPHHQWAVYQDPGGGRILLEGPGINPVAVVPRGAYVDPDDPWVLRLSPEGRQAARDLIMQHRHRPMTEREVRAAERIAAEAEADYRGEEPSPAVVIPPPPEPELDRSTSPSSSWLGRNWPWLVLIVGAGLLLWINRERIATRLERRGPPYQPKVAGA